MIIWTPRIRKILVISTSIKGSLDQLFSALIHENLAVGMTIDRRCSFRSSKLQSIHQNDYYNYALAQVRPLFSRRQRKHWRSLPTDEHHAFERRQLVSRKQRHRLTVVIAMTIRFPSSFLRTSGDRKQACLSDFRNIRRRGASRSGIVFAISAAPAACRNQHKTYPTAIRCLVMERRQSRAARSRR